MSDDNILLPNRCPKLDLQILKLARCIANLVPGAENCAHEVNKSITNVQSLSFKTSHSLSSCTFKTPRAQNMSKKVLQQKDVIVKLIVGAGQASPSPPVGPALGSKGVKSMDFCKVRLHPTLPLHKHNSHAELGIQRSHSKLHSRYSHTGSRYRPS